MLVHVSMRNQGNRTLTVIIPQTDLNIYPGTEPGWKLRNYQDRNGRLASCIQRKGELHSHLHIRLKKDLCGPRASVENFFRDISDSGKFLRLKSVYRLLKGHRSERDPKQNPRLPSCVASRKKFRGGFNFGDFSSCMKQRE